MQEDLQEAKDDLRAADTPAEESAAEARIARLERQLADLQKAHADHAAKSEGKADKEHEHPVPGELKALNDHLSAIVSAERSPKRRHWFNRSIGR